MAATFAPQPEAVLPHGPGSRLRQSHRPQLPQRGKARCGQSHRAHALGVGSTELQTGEEVQVNRADGRAPSQEPFKKCL